MNETITIAFVGSLAAIIGAISNALVNRHQQTREDRKAHQELEEFENNMLLNIASKYQNLVDPLELRINRLEQELREQREFYESQLVERNLEIAALKSQLIQYEDKTESQKKQITALSDEVKKLIRKIRALEGKENGQGQ